MKKLPLSNEAMSRLWVGCLVFSAAFAHFCAQQPYGLGWNRTASLPKGLYLTKQTNADFAPKVGDLVCFAYASPAWAHDRGYFPAGFRLCKPVAATAGDAFNVSAQGMQVMLKGQGGAALDASHKSFALPTTDSAGRPLPVWLPGEYPVPSGHILALSPYHPRSLDSRFLGPVAVKSLTHQIWPLLTWPHPDSKP